MPKLRAGVVGTGFIATKKHIPSWSRESDRVELVAIADVNGEAAAKAAGTFGIPASYSSLGDMLASERLDVIDICTPPRTHASVALEALAAGCHVMIEKPMATTVEECDQVIAAAAGAGRQICVAHSDLFYPPFMRARAAVDEGKIGTFRGMRVFLSTPIDYMTSNEDHWANKLPGGVIGESGPHVVYMALAFVNPIREVRAHATKQLAYPWSPYEDYRIDLVGDQGTCSVTSVYTTEEWAGQVDIWGSTGLMKLDLELMSLVEQGRKSLDRKQVALSGIRESAALLASIARTAGAALTHRYRNTHDYLIQGFVDSIVGLGPPPVSGEDGREAVRVMNIITDQLNERAD